MTNAMEYEIDCDKNSGACQTQTDCIKYSSLCMFFEQRTAKAPVPSSNDPVTSSLELLIGHTSWNQQVDMERRQDDILLGATLMQQLKLSADTSNRAEPSFLQSARTKMDSGTIGVGSRTQHDAEYNVVRTSVMYEEAHDDTGGLVTCYGGSQGMFSHDKSELFYQRQKLAELYQQRQELIEQGNILHQIDRQLQQQRCGLTPMTSSNAAMTGGSSISLLSLSNAFKYDE